MSLWEFLGWAFLVWLGANVVFVVVAYLCRRGKPEPLEPWIAAAQKQDADLFGQPHPRITTIPKPKDQQ